MVSKQSLRSILQEIHFSKEVVERFLQLLDEQGNDLDRLTLFAVAVQTLIAENELSTHVYFEVSPGWHAGGRQG